MNQSMESPFQNNLIESSWKRVNLTQSARKAVASSLKIVIVFVFLFVDMSYSVFSSLIIMPNPITWFVELSVAILLLFQLVNNGLLLFQYFWVIFLDSPPDITEQQSLLMALPMNNKISQSSPAPGQSPASPLNFSRTSSFSTLASTPIRASAASLTSNSSSQFHSQGHSSSFSPFSSYLNASTPSTSFSNSFNSSFDKSVNLSGMSSRNFDYDKASSLRSRRSQSLPLTSSASKYKHISDLHTLHRYISEEDERERIRTQDKPDNPGSGKVSFKFQGNNPLEVLKTYKYQVSSCSPSTPASTSSSDQTSSQGVGDIWSKYGVSEDDLFVWIENLRKWLSFTIISRLDEEIDEVNAALRKMGCDDTQVGDIGVSTLKQLALTKGNHLPSLSSLVSYLEFCNNQEYLRSRIRDLSTGSMSAYTWDKGGHYGKPWNEQLPTDAALVMHLFCSYLDSRLPAHPKYPNGKPFTAQHFVRAPDKPGTDRKDVLQIYNSSINPPHYQLAYGSQIFNLPKGRNNMFQAILLFLYHIKVKESGMLERVNLGISGLNLLWIFD